MVETPRDLKYDGEAHAKWQKKLGAMPLDELEAHALVVNSPSSSFYSLYVDHVNEELNLRHQIWVTRTGQRLTVREIEDDHLTNIIAKIERDHWRPRWLAAMKSELRRRKVLPVLGFKHQILLEEETMNGLFVERE
jgi:hypothetical protein